MTDKEMIRAEIERLKNEAWDSILADEPKYRTHYKIGKKEMCDEILTFIDSIEVKEVDLDFLIHEEYAVAAKTECDCIECAIFTKFDFTRLAKHFFELGVNASNSLTWKDMMLIHKCCKDAMNYNLYAWQTAEGQQKIYEDVLKRFKARKGE